MSQARGDGTGTGKRRKNSFVGRHRVTGTRDGMWSRPSFLGGMYAELRTRYHLPSQLACSVERQVAATYKGLWTKLLKNAEHRRKKITKKRFKGLDKPPKYSSPTVQYARRARLYLSA